MPAKITAITRLPAVKNDGGAAMAVPVKPASALVPIFTIAKKRESMIDGYPVYADGKHIGYLNEHSQWGGSATCYAFFDWTDGGFYRETVDNRDYDGLASARRHLPKDLACDYKDRQRVGTTLKEEMCSACAQVTRFVPVDTFGYACEKCGISLGLVLERREQAATTAPEQTTQGDNNDR